MSAHRYFDRVSMPNPSGDYSAFACVCECGLCFATSLSRNQTLSTEAPFDWRAAENSFDAHLRKVGDTQLMQPAALGDCNA
jgi:hypothetical protein